MRCTVAAQEPLPHPRCGCVVPIKRNPKQRNSLLGREVATLVAGETVSAGAHTVQFNADGLASSTYLIRMEAGDLVATQQVVLVK